MKCIVKVVVFMEFFLVHILSAYSQHRNTDSLKTLLRSQKEDSNKVNSLIALGRSVLEDGETEIARQYFDTAQQLSEKIDFKKGSGRSYYYISSTYKNQFNYSQAISNALLALKYFEGGEPKYIANTYLLIGEVYDNQDVYPDALKNYYSALKSFEQVRDTINVIYTELSIGTVFHSQKNYSDALTIYKDALKKSEEVANERLIAMCSGVLGVLYYEQGNYAEALRMDSVAFHIFEKRGEKKGIAVLLYEIGKVFEKQGQREIENGNIPASGKKLNQALTNYHSALEIFEKSDNDPWGLVNIYINLGSVNTRLKRFPEARYYYQKCIELSRTIGNKFELRDGYLGLSNLDSIQGDYKQAYNHYKTYIVYRDSMANDEVNKASLQAKLDYEFQKKEAVSKAEQAKREAEARLTSNLQYSAIGIFLVLAGFLYWNNRQQQKAKTKIEKAYSALQATQAQLIQSEKMASLGELTAGIAHEIQNPLNFVNNFSEVNSELVAELVEEIEKGNMEEVKLLATGIKENEQKIIYHGKRADAIVKGMLQHSRSNTGQKEPTDINALADEYLRLSYHGLRAKDKSFNAMIETNYDNHIGKINIVPQDIGRVLLNLYNNAFYAVAEKKRRPQPPEGGVEYEPTVSIKTTLLTPSSGARGVEIKVTDNGNGIPPNIIEKVFQPFFTTKPTGQGTGLGLSLSYDIIKAHAGEMRIETPKNGGATFIIILPLHNSV